MKQKITYLLLCFLALLVFYGGAGVNLVTYCCGDCQTEGVAVLLEDKCCEIHEHHHCDTTHEEGSTCSVPESDADCCDVDRVDFKWNIFQAHLLNLQPVAVDIPAFLLSQLAPVLDPLVAQFRDQQQEDPPILCPTTYFKRLSTLII